MMTKQRMCLVVAALATLLAECAYGMQLPPSMHQILVVNGYKKPKGVRRYNHELRYRVLTDPAAAAKVGVISLVPDIGITKVVEIQSVTCMPNGTPCLYVILYYTGEKGSEFMDGVAYRHDPLYTLPKEDSGVYVTMENMFDHFKNDFLAVYNRTKKK